MSRSKPCRSSVSTEPRIQVAIVGGGRDRLELSAELRNTAQVLSAYGLHKLDPRHDVGIVLIEAGPRILPALQERVSTATAELLTKLGVKLMIGETVAEVAPGIIRTASGKTVRADLTVWAAGIRAPAILSQLDGLPVNRLGQLNVRRTLQTEIDDNVFALGDCAACPWPGNERNVPPRAQAAHQQASFLMKALAAPAGEQAVARIHLSRLRLAGVARAFQRGGQSHGRRDRREHADRRSVRTLHVHVAVPVAYRRVARLCAHGARYFRALAAPFYAAARQAALTLREGCLLCNGTRARRILLHPLPIEERRMLKPEIDSLVPHVPFDRRTFIKAALGTGFAAAVLPVSAQTIHTDSDGLEAGEIGFVRSGDTLVPAYRAQPKGKTHLPVIIVMHEIFGVHEHIADVCRRFAKLGYLAIAPNLYAREGDPIVVPTDPAIQRSTGQQGAR